ncbi:protein CBFA2T1 isoform X5 [Prionailurus viverrinus]|uniref:Protein CBFA2T1 isoform X5 n=1 Tax=Acinonyx jubatus TaxID=32536 RepID=A0ABM3NYM1_ACIJB|nr:protein CBFA2T1 isoform X6 [Felis catus]XP_042779262.1 protein CBFA2T1 isoform X7 [Panthera leo]XP_042828768.1 protein CBFA2T1 isoform X7 [Panthera tigris]XP_047698215.1 protein CBFA2T1 isoform X5 [Prionailurus viverrinus]XP_049489123.1 protein CBFA2T1 isoform X4 [Panthera uncia]XP_053064526.1 protein CBFA2T1 isoform X5 [Acinonyx jubatus]XP_058554529.1 protein CBFA2T1 isoform X5 [Neofelis nebulosa]XP_060466873.1 protein CBFA2T1 isoform X5 [Panthera onca]
MISVKRNTWRALSLVIGDCRKKGNFEYCQDRTEKHSTMPDSPVDVKTPSRLTPPTMPPPPTTQGAPRTSSFTPTTLTNGTSHSPTALNGAPSPPNGFSNGPSSSSSSSLANQQLPPACGARQLSKLKRFLTTLQQFGNDISPEIGERVRTLVLGLVNSTLTIEEFHSKLQEATNFPLRPFVIPFLKANLPLLQRELLHCARLAKQNPAQYLAQHEQLLLDASTTSPVDSSELLLDVNENGKRRTPDRTKENGFDREPLHSEHPSKRPCTISPGQRYSPNNGLSYQPNGLPHPTPPPPQHYRLDDMAIAHHYRDSYRHPSHRDLRDRNRPMDAHREFLHRPASGYVPEEIWKKAEEAVNEVKRQAMTELQKAVSEAERKAHDMITTERAKMERTVAEAKRQAAEDALAVINQQEDSSESCWNCGRKASETCSGCNTARYCGSFCQHKDWEKHHHICGQTLQAQQQGDTPAVSSSVTPNSGAGSPMDTPPAATPRSTTPGTPSTIETTPR